MQAKTCGYTSRLPEYHVGFNNVDLQKLSVCQQLTAHGLLLANAIVAGNVASDKARIEVIDAREVKSKIVKVWNELYVNGNARIVKSFKADADGVFKKDLYVHGNIWSVSGTTVNLVAGSATDDTSVMNGNLRVEKFLSVGKDATVEGHLTANASYTDMSFTNYLYATKSVTSNVGTFKTLHVTQGHADDLTVMDRLLVGGHIVSNARLLYSINVSNVDIGVLPVPHGGTGAESFQKDALVVGNGVHGLYAPGFLTVDAQESTLHIDGRVSGNAEMLHSINASNVTIGVMSVTQGGTGRGALDANRVLVGSGTSEVLSPSELAWDGSELSIVGDLSISGYIKGDGSKLVSINASNIDAGVTSVAHGGTGRFFLDDRKILVGAGADGITSSELYYSQGLLGIHVPNPTEALDVLGNALVTGDVSITGGLFADGRNLTSLNAASIESGVLGVSVGGTGATAHAKDRLIAGNLEDPLYDAANLVYDPNQGFLGVGGPPQSLLHVYGDTLVQGNLTVIGTRVEQTTVEALVDNNIIVLNASLTDTTFSGESGILVNRGLQTSAALIWDESTQRWEFGKQGSTIPIAGYDPFMQTGMIPVFNDFNRNFSGFSELKFDTQQGLQVDGKVSASSFHGSGTNVTQLDASKVSQGVLPVGFGGTGNIAFQSGGLIVGGGTGPLRSAGDIVYDETTGSLAIGSITPQSGTKFAVGGHVAVKGHVLPAEDIIYDLGSPTSRWRDLYMSGDSIFLGNAILRADQEKGVFSVKNVFGQDMQVVANVDMSNVGVGTLAVNHGGTGIQNFPRGSFLVGNGSEPILAASNIVYDELIGALGIGRNPETTLDIQGDVRVSGNILQNDDRLGLWKMTQDDTYTYIDSGVAIGGVSQDPFSRLYVNGNLFATGSVTTASDARLKCDVLKIDGALEKLMNVSGYTYRRTDTEDASRHAGLLAQEVANVLPEVVRVRSDGMLGISYDNFGALLVEAIKDLATEVRELRSLVVA